MTTKQYKKYDVQIISTAEDNFSMIDAICRFKYNGYIIDILTSYKVFGTLKPYICVYNIKKPTKVVEHNFNTVEDAINYINELNSIKCEFCDKGVEHIHHYPGSPEFPVQTFQLSSMMR